MQLKEKKDEEKNLIKNLNKKLLIIQKTKKMNLKELKSMIASEYKTYIAEQPVPAGPGVAVSDADIDATEGGGDAETTLRDIYEMLKAHFEGGATDTADTADADIPDEMDDAEVSDDDDADEDVAEALQERFKKLANIIKG